MTIGGWLDGMTIGSCANKLPNTSPISSSNSPMGASSGWLRSSLSVPRSAPRPIEGNALIRASPQPPDSRGTLPSEMALRLPAPAHVVVVAVAVAMSPSPPRPSGSFLSPPVAGAPSPRSVRCVSFGWGWRIELRRCVREIDRGIGLRAIGCVGRGACVRV